MTLIRYLCQKFFFICALVLILLAVLVQSGRSFFPLLERYHQPLVDYVSEQLQLDIELGTLKTDWQELKPSITLGDLKVKDPAGHVLLSADRAQLQVNLWASFWQLGWVLEGFELSNTRVDLVQTEQGFWSLPGMGARESKGLPKGLQTLFQLGTRIEFVDTQLNLSFASGHQRRFAAPYVLMENDGDFHRLSLEVDLEHQPRALYSVLEVRPDSAGSNNRDIQGYLRLQQFPTLEALTAMGGLLTGEAEQRGWYKEGYMDASLWFSSEPAQSAYNLEGEFALTGVTLPAEGVSLNRVSGELLGHWRAGTDWSLSLQQLKADWAEQNSPPVNLKLSANPEQSQLEVAIDRLDLGYWTQQLNRLGFLGEGRLRDALTSLSPEGQVNKLHLTLPREDLGQWRLAAELDSVSVSPWQGVPQLTQLNGYVEADRDAGRVFLDSQKGFGMLFPGHYTQPLEFLNARGQIAWHLVPEKNRIYVNSGPLDLQGEQEQTQVHMWLSMPWEPKTADVDLTLDIRGRDMALGLYSKYLPRAVPDDLRAWLDRAIGSDNPGLARQARFLYRGTVQAQKPPSHPARLGTYQLALDLQNAQLNYASDWPQLAEVDAHLSLDNQRLDAVLEQAQVYNSRIGRGRIALDDNPEGEGLLLEVEASLDGLASDGLRLLRESYLRQFVGENMDTWFMHGDLQADLSLALPLTEGAPGNRQRVAMNLDVPKVAMDNFDLAMNNLRGRMVWEGETGLSAEQLTAELFSQPVTMNIRSDLTQGQVPRTELSIDGKVSVADFKAWSQRPELMFLDGVIDYTGRVQLMHHPELPENTDKPLAELRFNSDLAGVSVDLPEPYGKSAETSRPLAFTMNFRQKTRQVALTYADQVEALLQLDEASGDLLKANLALEQAAQLPEQPSLHLSGAMETVDLEVWERTLDRYLAEGVRMTEASGEEDLAVTDLPLTADLTIARHSLGPLVLEDLSVQASELGDGWRLQLANERLAGQLDIPAGDTEPMIVNLERLALYSEDFADADAESAPNTGAFTPEDIAPAQVKVQNLTLDEEDFGWLSFALAPQPYRLEINDIRGEIRGLTLSGTEEGEGAHLEWTLEPRGPERTRLEGQVSAGNLAEVMNLWDQPDVIDSESARYDLNLFWAGAPQDFAVEKLQGDLSLAIEDGRFKRNPAEGSEGLLRLFAVLNFDSLARRLRLDFSDLYQSGLAYDEIDGQFTFDRGHMYFAEPLLVRSPSSRLQMAGSVDLVQETLDTRLVATLPVAGNLTFLTALAAGLPAAAGVYVISKIFAKQVDKATSVSYTITGDWDDPKVKFDQMFDGDVRLTGEKDIQPEEAP